MWDPLEKKVLISQDVTFDEMSILRRSGSMKEQEGELQVQQGNIGQLTQFSILPPIGIAGGFDIQMEHTHRVPSQVERARIDDRGHEDQQEQARLGGIEVALYKPKRIIRQLDRYGFGEMVSYALVIANGDLYTYAEAMKSPDRERWVQAMSEEMYSLHKNDT